MATHEIRAYDERLMHLRNARGLDRLAEAVR